MLIYAFFVFILKKIQLIGGFPDPTHKGHLAALLDDQLKKNYQTHRASYLHHAKKH
jgi:hypothetical protein